MKISEGIKQRRSVFPNQFTGQNVTKEKILQLLEAANWAPSHRKTNPWRFKVFTGESLTDLADKITAAYTRFNTEKNYSAFKLKKSVEKVLSSGAVIAICMQRDLKERLPEWEEIAATAIAVQNMWLTTAELNLGGYWSSPEYITVMQEELQLAEGERCLGFFYLGEYHAELPRGDRDPVEDKVTWF